MKRRLKGKAYFFLALGLVIIGLGMGLFIHFAYVPVILMYHSVGPADGYDAKLNISPEVFAKQMKFLRDHKYNVIPLSDFIKKIKNGERVPHKTVAITFDDGLRNNFLMAYPALKKHGLSATIFVIADFVGKEGFLTWDDIVTMQQNNIDIGSHTKSHRWLPDLSEPEMQDELLGSKYILEKNTGCKIEILSYPLGGFNRKIQETAASAGYTGAVATNPGRKHPKNDSYALKRIRISMSTENLFAFWGETCGYYTFIKEIRDSD